MQPHEWGLSDSNRPVFIISEDVLLPKHSLKAATEICTRDFSMAS